MANARSAGLTLDASVFVSAARPAEAHHPSSRTLLDRLSSGERPLIQPTLLQVEMAGAIARGVGGPALAQRVVQHLRRLPHVLWVGLDDVLAAESAELAARLRLRGADAVYAAVAQRFGTTLVTLDADQRKRCTGAVATTAPAALLRSWR